MRVNSSLILLILVSLSSRIAFTASNCNRLYFSPESEESIELIIDNLYNKSLSQKEVIKQVHTIAVSKLRARGIKYTKKTIDGVEVVFITPGSKTKLGRLARAIKKSQGTRLGFSLGHTGGISGALAMPNANILITSIEDVIRNNIGMATRHELAHFRSYAYEEMEYFHPLFSTELQTQSRSLFTSEELLGYNEYVSFDEIHAYAVDLYHGLWRLHKSSDPVAKKMLETNVENSFHVLAQMASSFKNKIKYFASQKLTLISSDGYERVYISKNKNILRIPNSFNSTEEHFKFLIDELDSFRTQLMAANNDEELMGFLKSYLVKSMELFKPL